MQYNNLLNFVSKHHNVIISHLNLVGIFLRFGSFNMYIYEDTMDAL